MWGSARVGLRLNLLILRVPSKQNDPVILWGDFQGMMPQWVCASAGSWVSVAWSVWAAFLPSRIGSGQFSAALVLPLRAGTGTGWNSSILLSLPDLLCNLSRACSASPEEPEGGGCVLTDLLVPHHRPQVGVFICGREAQESCWCPTWQEGWGMVLKPRQCWSFPLPTHKGEALHGRTNAANPAQAFSHLPQNFC